MTEVFEHGYAIVIGVDDNRIKRLALPTVAKDVQAIHDVLIHPERCAYKEENVKLLKGSESTRENILDALYWIQEKVEADPEATAVIYYSGHGMEDKQSDKYYLIPYDTKDLKRVKTYAIKATDLTEAISSIAAKRLLVMLDCCHAAGMDVKDVNVETLEEGKEEEKIVKRVSFPLDNFSETKDIPDYAGEPGVSKAVSNLAEGNGRAILNSSTDSQSSYIRNDNAMSIFTYHLIEALTGHVPHSEDDTVVLVTDVMSWVTREVAKSAKKENRNQTPVMKTSGVFPIAQLIGGQGVAKGLGGIAPDPLAQLPEHGTTITFNQEGQTVGGSQVNAGGDVNIGQIGDTINTGGGDVVHGSVDKSTTNVNTGGGAYVGGDQNIHGDQIGGDNTSGDKITTGNISGTNTGISIGRNTNTRVETTVNEGDTFNMSGDFRGAMLNIKSTLSNVQQTIGSMPTSNNAEKQNLQNLVKQLEQILTKVPEANVDDADAVSQTTEALINMAAEDKPNKTMLQITGEGLKQAAQNLAAVTPEVLTIATSIVMTIGKLSGIG